MFLAILLIIPFFAVLAIGLIVIILIGIGIILISLVKAFKSCSEYECKVQVLGNIFLYLYCFVVNCIEGFSWERGYYRRIYRSFKKT